MRTYVTRRIRLPSARATHSAYSSTSWKIRIRVSTYSQWDARARAIRPRGGDVTENSALVALTFAIASATTFNAAGGTANLQVSNLQAELGSIVSVMVSIESAPNEASAFGMEVHYDFDFLSYTDTFIGGELSQGFTLFDVNESEPGKLIVAGVTTENAVSAGASGVLVLLEFEIIACPADPVVLSIGNLVDDFENWTTAPGSIECGQPVLVLSDDVLRVPAAVGDTTLVVSNGGEGELMWEAEVISGAGWLDVSPDSGNGMGTVTVSYAANSQSTTRGGRLEFRSTDPALDSVLVDVIQSAAANTGG